MWVSASGAREKFLSRQSVQKISYMVVPNAELKDWSMTMNSIRDKNFEVELPLFNGSLDDDLQLWELTLKAALQCRNLVNAIDDRPAEK